jgi:hypothetical protein
MGWWFGRLASKWENEKGSALQRLPLLKKIKKTFYVLFAALNSA